jgi:superfamily I DNA/RNA helicase
VPHWSPHLTLFTVYCYRVHVEAGVDNKVMFDERDQLVRELANSADPLKAVVAGPGTGKTYAIKELLKAREGDKLVLTFVNNLVDRLETDLGDLAKVQTLHGFARRLLHRHETEGLSRAFDYYPSLTEILNADARIMLAREVGHREVENAMHELKDSADVVHCALRSGTYYDAVGHTDSVHRVVHHLWLHPEDAPRFEQIVVDEFQDFNLLEVSLIEQLSASSPTLIVGDDDQALYAFKCAKPDYLREVVARAECVRFELPFCSRCTKALVEGVHRTVAAAEYKGLLLGRVPKRYECFTPSKRLDSERYPKIIHAKCSVERNNAQYICSYIGQQIGLIPPQDVAVSIEGDYPTVLVTGPKQFSARVAAYLLGHGIPNVSASASPSLQLDPLDAYRRLAKKPWSRLGWRILLHLEAPEGRDEIVRRALDEGDEIIEILPADFRSRHLALATIVEKVIGRDPIDAGECRVLEAALERPIEEVHRILGVADEGDATPPPTVEGAPSVKVTTLEGAKGLQAEHVFVVGMNERHFPKDNQAPSDHEVCCMIVALTRATKCCHLVSCQRFGSEELGPSVFIEWLGDLVKPVVVNKGYFAANRLHDTKPMT